MDGVRPGIGTVEEGVAEQVQKNYCSADADPTLPTEPLELLLRRSLAPAICCRRVLAVAWLHATALLHALATLLHFLLELLFLGIGHHRFQLSARAHHQLTHLLPTFLWI